MISIESRNPINNYKDYILEGRLLQNPRFHLLLLTFNPYGVDIVKRITPLASCFHPR